MPPRLLVKFKVPASLATHGGGKPSPPPAQAIWGNGLRGQFAGVWRPGQFLGPKKPFLRSLVDKIRDALRGLLQRLEAGAWPNFSDPAPQLGR